MDLQHKLPLDKNVPIKLEFPDGSTLNSRTPSIRAIAYFTSEKPLAFTSKIDFYDNEGQKFSIRVSGSTDNCLFSTFSYIVSKSDKYEIKVTPFPWALPYILLA